MVLEDHEFPAGGGGNLFEAFTDIQFLGGKQFEIKSANTAKRGGFAEDERAGQGNCRAADPVPERGDYTSDPMRRIEADGAAAGQHLAGLDGLHDVGKQLRRWT